MESELYTKENSEYLLTVFCVTYNHVDTFKRAIESVLGQKTNFAFKVVVLDDASTDGTSEIVKTYSNYPNVYTVIREENSSGKNLYLGLQELNTKYYTVLETDDYWCDENKLQKQVDILEANPDCSFCAHNTLEICPDTGAEHIYIKGHSTKKFKFPEKLNNKNYIEPHTSSRLYRSEYLNLDKIKDSVIATYDICNNFYFLSQGNMYYIDEVMSVYNYNNKGVFSSKHPFEQRYVGASIIRRLNKEFNYKYNKLLVRLFAFKLSIKGIPYLLLKYTRNPENLDLLYEKALKDFKEEYLNQNYDIKPIWKFKIPYGKNKRYVLEFKREKERL